MPVCCTEHQDLVGEKDERGKALSANVVKSAGKLPYFPSYLSDINRDDLHCRMAGPPSSPTLFFIPTLIKSIVGDDRVPPFLQYRSSDLYLTDRKETMAILQKDTHTPLHICK